MDTIGDVSPRPFAPVLGEQHPLEPACQVLAENPDPCPAHWPPPVELPQPPRFRPMWQPFPLIPVIALLVVKGAVHGGLLGVVSFGLGCALIVAVGWWILRKSHLRQQAISDYYATRAELIEAEYRARRQANARLYAARLAAIRRGEL